MSTKLYITPDTRQTCISGPYRKLAEHLDVKLCTCVGRVPGEAWTCDVHGYYSLVKDFPPELVALLDQAVEEYWDELQESPLTNKSVEDYFWFAYCFVRWCRGEFSPGSHVRE